MYTMNYMSQSLVRLYKQNEDLTARIERTRILSLEALKLRVSPFVLIKRDFLENSTRNNHLQNIDQVEHTIYATHIVCLFIEAGEEVK